MTTLYNVCTTIDNDGQQKFRISKFVDGELESSYLLTRETCECPAGVRPSCRHRQMLPEMLNRGLLNTHYFLDWDQGMRTCDFQGSTVLPPSMTHPAEDTSQDTQPAPLEGELITAPTADGWDAKDITPPSAPAWRRF